FVLFLLRGVKQFRSSFIACYLCGLAIRIILYLAFLLIIGFVNFVMVFKEDDEATLTFFRTKVAIKTIICAWYTILKIYLFITVHRFYSYIIETTAYFRLSAYRQIVTFGSPVTKQVDKYFNGRNSFSSMTSGENATRMTNPVGALQQELFRFTVPPTSIKKIQPCTTTVNL
ncbi:hypothetical protein OSTOST_01019, partial [Ostertagia ostertagi]